MQVTVSGRHHPVPEALRQQAVDKIGRLDRYLSGMERAEVHFWVEGNASTERREMCEVTMEGHGHHVRCKVTAPDGYTAVDLAVDKLEGQLRKLKSKVVDRRQRRQRPALPDELVPESLVPPVPPGDGRAQPTYRIVKEKRFEVKAMDPQEAALQMDLLDHDFYLFTHRETGSPAVVYRRGDGDIGLIEAR
jgi:putative sigma-54 modulation protein